MKRFKAVLTAYVQEAYGYLNTGRDDHSSFINLIRYIKTLIEKKEHNDDTLYVILMEEIKRINDSKLPLSNYTKESYPNIFQGIHNLITLLHYYEVITRKPHKQSHTVFKTILDKDPSPLNKFTVLTLDKKLKYFPLDIIQALQKIHQALPAMTPPGEFLNMLESYGIADEIESLKNRITFSVNEAWYEQLQLAYKDRHIQKIISPIPTRLVSIKLNEDSNSLFYGSVPGAALYNSSMPTTSLNQCTFWNPITSGVSIDLSRIFKPIHLPAEIFHEDSLESKLR